MSIPTRTRKHCLLEMVIGDMQMRTKKKKKKREKGKPKMKKKRARLKQILLVASASCHGTGLRTTTSVRNLTSTLRMQKLKTAIGDAKMRKRKGQTCQLGQASREPNDPEHNKQFILAKFHAAGQQQLKQQGSYIMMVMMTNPVNSQCMARRPWGHS